MNTTPQLPLVTQLDVERLQRVLEVQGDSAQVEALELKLSRARVLRAESVPPDVITMNSTAVVEDAERGERLELTLCYPQAARGVSGGVSVLAPVGSALLGLSPGECVELPLPRGRTRQLRVLAVPYQPEAAGHFHL